MISVVNRYRPKRDPETIRINCFRPNVLSNPVEMHDKTDAERTRVIDAYAHYLAEQLADPTSAVTREIERLAALSRTHNIELACYCAPKRCHSELIRDEVLKRVAAGD